MKLPDGLITGVASRLPSDWKQQPARGRVRHERGKMNRAEAAYAADLEVRKRAGEILDWWFEAVTLRLADKPEGTKLRGTTYTPDFMVQLADGTISFHEVKGFARDDAVVKFKAAAEKFPFHFLWVQK